MASVDYFLKLDGIQGESTDSKHKNEIDIESWSWSQNNDGSHAYGGGGGAGKVNMHDFSFSMKHNKASPKLFLACATGDHINRGCSFAARRARNSRNILRSSSATF